jgi:hypothetical protein
MSARSMKFLILIGIGVVALLAAGQAAATRTIKIPSAISINVKKNSLHFTGTVTAGKYQPCQQFRKVSLLKVATGGPGQVVGHATTNAHGQWSIVPQGSAGISMATFQAKVKKSSQGAAGTIYVCNAATSKKVTPSR